MPKISELPVLAVVPADAMVPFELGGKLYRAPRSSFQGSTGTNGLQGAPGLPSRLWFRYAQNALMTTTRFLSDQLASGGDTSETGPLVAAYIAPADGRLLKLRVKVENAHSAGNTSLFTARVNGIDTGLFVRFDSAAGTVQVSSVAVNITAGDVITLKHEQTQSAGAPGGGITHASIIYECPRSPGLVGNKISRLPSSFRRGPTAHL